MHGPVVVATTQQPTTTATKTTTATTTATNYNHNHQILQQIPNPKTSTTTTTTKKTQSSTKLQPNRSINDHRHNNNHRHKLQPQSLDLQQIPNAKISIKIIMNNKIKNSKSVTNTVGPLQPQTSPPQNSTNHRNNHDTTTGPKSQPNRSINDPKPTHRNPSQILHPRPD